MKYKNLKATIIISILLGLASCNGEDNSKSEIMENSEEPSEENVLSIDQIKNSQEEFLVQEIENPDENEPDEPEEEDEEDEEVLEDEPTDDDDELQ